MCAEWFVSICVDKHVGGMEWEAAPGADSALAFSIPHSALS